jgi:hypothetical protein
MASNPQALVIYAQVEHVGVSLGSFSVSCALLEAFMQEFATEIAGKMVLA